MLLEAATGESKEIREKTLISTSVSVRRQPGALDVVSDYAAAIIARDPERMKTLRAKTCLLDLVQLDAFKVTPHGPGAGETMYAALFDAFPDADLEVLRTIARRSGRCPGVAVLG